MGESAVQHSEQAPTLTQQKEGNPTKIVDKKRKKSH